MGGLILRDWPCAVKVLPLHHLQVSRSRLIPSQLTHRAAMELLQRLLIRHHLPTKYPDNIRILLWGYFSLCQLSIS